MAAIETGLDQGIGRVLTDFEIRLIDSGVTDEEVAAALTTHRNELMAWRTKRLLELRAWIIQCEAEDLKKLH